MYIWFSKSLTNMQHLEPEKKYQLIIVQEIVSINHSAAVALIRRVLLTDKGWGNLNTKIKEHLF
jgi:hypothetical protein